MKITTHLAVFDAVEKATGQEWWVVAPVSDPATAEKVARSAGIDPAGLQVSGPRHMLTGEWIMDEAREGQTIGPEDVGSVEEVIGAPEAAPAKPEPNETPAAPDEADEAAGPAPEPAEAPAAPEPKVEAQADQGPRMTSSAAPPHGDWTKVIQNPGSGRLETLVDGILYYLDADTNAWVSPKAADDSAQPMSERVRRAQGLE